MATQIGERQTTAVQTVSDTTTPGNIDVVAMESPTASSGPEQRIGSDAGDTSSSVDIGMVAGTSIGSIIVVLLVLVVILLLVLVLRRRRSGQKFSNTFENLAYDGEPIILFSAISKFLFLIYKTSVNIFRQHGYPSGRHWPDWPDS